MCNVTCLSCMCLLSFEYLQLYILVLHIFNCFSLLEVFKFSVVPTFYYLLTYSCILHYFYYYYFFCVKVIFFRGDYSQVNMSLSGASISRSDYIGKVSSYPLIALVPQLLPAGDLCSGGVSLRVVCINEHYLCYFVTQKSGTIVVRSNLAIGCKNIVHNHVQYTKMQMSRLWSCFLLGGQI